MLKGSWKQMQHKCLCPSVWVWGETDFWSWKWKLEQDLSSNKANSSRENPDSPERQMKALLPRPASPSQLLREGGSLGQGQGGTTALTLQSGSSRCRERSGWVGCCPSNLHVLRSKFHLPSQSFGTFQKPISRPFASSTPALIAPTHPHLSLLPHSYLTTDHWCISDCFGCNRM